MQSARLAAVQVQRAGHAQAARRGRAAELHVAREAHVEHDRVHRAQLRAQRDAQAAQAHRRRRARLRLALPGAPLPPTVVPNTDLLCC